ncbi:hypothetical protein ACRAWD_31585 [Caulobacter segnis]
MIAVRDGDAILMAQKAAQQLGLGVGISSGAQSGGGGQGPGGRPARRARRPHTDAATTTPAICSTALAQEEPARPCPAYLTPRSNCWAGARSNAAEGWTQPADITISLEIS